jgi:Protein of unknown function (DUF3037)
VRALSSYDYVLIRVVPNVERGECLNVGVLLFCRTLCFLGVRIHLDQARVLALAPDFDLAAVQQQLDDIVRICKGGPKAGLLGQMSQSERFHWLVSPRSTIIQTSQVHSGLSADPEAALEHLLKTMVYR